jgi:uncharacterized protein YdhG (YjbR/CyaY superfamily)
MSAKAAPASIDDYIARSSPEGRGILERVRSAIWKAAPEAEETISYRIPAFTQDGVFIFFAAFKKHIGIYPPLAANSPLREELKPYEGPKRNLQIPLDGRIPYALITRIAKCRLAEHLETKARRKKRPR